MWRWLAGRWGSLQWCRSGLRCKPKVDTCLESAARAVVGDRLTVRKVKAVATGGCAAGPDVFLGDRTLTDAVAGLHAKCASIGAESGAEVGDGVGDGNGRRSGVGGAWPGRSRRRRERGWRLVRECHGGGSADNFWLQQLPRKLREAAVLCSSSKHGRNRSSIRDEDNRRKVGLPCLSCR